MLSTKTLRLSNCGLSFNTSEIISRVQIWTLQKNQSFTKGRAKIECARFVQGLQEKNRKFLGEVDEKITVRFP